MSELNKDTQVYPADVLQLLDKNGFISAYYSELKNYDRFYDAYEHLEEIHEYYFKTRKYSNYECFKVILSQNSKK